MVSKGIEYRCVKSYPEFNRGDIIYPWNYLNPNSRWYKKIKGGCDYVVKIGHPSKYPEFWEKVVEKDYEILKLKCKYSSPTHSVSNIINHVETIDCQNYFKMDGCFDIYSVKRLSDGQVFAVGDKIVSKNGNTAKIIEFNISDNYDFGMGIIADRVCFDGFNDCCVSFIDHYKERLLLTEDRVELFEGDKYYNVFFEYSSNKGIIPFTISGPNNVFKEEGSTTYSKKSKFFSTREAAEEYIEQFKPRYTKEDMLDFAVAVRFKGKLCTHTPHLETWFKEWNNGSKR